MIVELLESNWCNWNHCLWIHEEICGYVGILRKFCAMMLFLMLESCLFKCIEPLLTHKHFLELGLGVGGFEKWDFR